jgi:hypothetical protein
VAAPLEAALRARLAGIDERSQRAVLILGIFVPVAFSGGAS